jgi:epoxyqueuosine reductase
MAASPDIRDWLAAAAQKEGFAFIRVAPARLPDMASRGLARFLADDFEGDMSWLRDSADRRSQPVHMWPEARSAIVCAMNYGPDHDPMDNLAATGHGNISVYARGRDYHDVIKGKLKQLAGSFAAKSGAAVKVFVDTAPLMEKPLAAEAGAGWQGKHTNLVARDGGSWLFLGVILTDAELVHDSPGQDHCGSCTKCLDICPTNAFPAPYRLDARRCISYLTIEHKGQIPREFRAAIGNRIFGCDDCLAVCPWNKYAARASEAKLQARPASTLPPLAELLALDDSGFRARFAGTPVRRAGYGRFMRNVLVAAGNSGDPTLAGLVTAHLGSDSPLVRGMAVWAARQLVDEESFALLRISHLDMEDDTVVQSEWHAAP